MADKIEFNIVFEKFPGEFEKELIAIEGSINDNLVTTWDDLPINILELYRPKFESGNFYIWTCTCGMPECGGVYRGITVVQEGDQIIWKNLDYPLEGYSKLEFESKLYRENIDKMLQEFRNIYFNSKYSKVDFGFCPNLFEAKIIELVERK